MSEWNILCLKLKDGYAAPIAKTKRELSTKEARRLCRKFSKDEDFVGEWVLPSSRFRLSDIELKGIPTIK